MHSGFFTLVEDLWSNKKIIISILFIVLIASLISTYLFNITREKTSPSFSLTTSLIPGNLTQRQKIDLVNTALDLIADSGYQLKGEKVYQLLTAEKIVLPLMNFPDYTINVIRRQYSQSDFTEAAINLIMTMKFGH